MSHHGVFRYNFINFDGETKAQDGAISCAAVYRGLVAKPKNEFLASTQLL